MNELIQAWYDLLNGNLTYNSQMVGVFKEDLPEDYPPSSNFSDHYVWIHAGDGSDDSNKKRFVDNDIVIVDIVTIFKNNVNRLVVETIDASIRSLVYSSPTVHNFTEPANMQFGQTMRETFGYVYEPSEQVGEPTVYRKVSRYKTRVIYA